MKVRKVYVAVVVVVVLVILFGTGFSAYNYLIKKNVLPSAPGFSQDPIDYEAPQAPEDPPITPFRALHAKILLVPHATASAAEKKEYLAFVSKYASKQNSVTLKDCRADPIVIWVKNGSDITIKNEDNTDHEISMNDKSIKTVPKKGSAKIKADFGRGPGLYAYECDDSEGPVGIFLVASK